MRLFLVRSVLNLNLRCFKIEIRCFYGNCGDEKHLTFIWTINYCYNRSVMYYCAWKENFNRGADRMFAQNSE